VSPEGWYRDPFGLHDARWISDGVPTDLVRDDGVESRDEAPGVLFPEMLVEADDMSRRAGDGDVRRADDGANGSEPYSARTAVESALTDPFAQRYFWQL
jgi:hypothetical protein